MITYEVRPEREHYAVGEPIRAYVKITNGGKAPLEFLDPRLAAAPQPVHELIGPAARDTVRFTNTKLLDAVAEPEPGTEQPQITVKPGGRWSAQINISAIVNPTTHGTYRLTSTLKAGQTTLTSTPSTFTLGALNITDAHLAAGTRPIDNGEGEIAFLHSDDRGCRIYTFTYLEAMPSIGETALDKPVLRAEASTSARDIVLPARNTPYFDEMDRWVLWLEGKRVFAVHSSITDPLTAELKVAPAHLIRPALKCTDGPVEVFALTSDNRQLEMISFPASGEENGRSAWSVDLPAEPLNMTVCLGPESVNSRHFAFAAERDGLIHVYYARSDGPKAPSEFQSAALDAVSTLIPGAPIALVVDDDGTAHVAVIAFQEGTEHAAAYVEQQFEADAKPRSYCSKVNLGMYDEPVVEGGLLLIQDHGVLARPQAVIRLADNRLFRMMPNGGVAQVIDAGIPFNPILLAAGKQGAYILCIDSIRGLYLEPL